jgi:hypothetical protein
MNRAEIEVLLHDCVIQEIPLQAGFFYQLDNGRAVRLDDNGTIHAWDEDGTPLDSIRGPISQLTPRAFVYAIMMGA